MRKGLERSIDQYYPYSQGKLWDRYQVYLACTQDSPPKSFEEWLES